MITNLELSSNASWLAKSYTKKTICRRLKSTQAHENHREISQVRTGFHGFFMGSARVGNTLGIVVYHSN